MNDEIAPENNPSEDFETSYADSLGARATAAAKSALLALITGEFVDPVGIILPEGDVPYFQLSYESIGEYYATAGIVWHEISQEQAVELTVISTVFPAPPGSGIMFQPGDGMTETDIDPLTRQLTTSICEEICNEHQLPTDLLITISVPERGQASSLGG